MKTLTDRNKYYPTVIYKAGVPEREKNKMKKGAYFKKYWILIT